MITLKSIEIEGFGPVIIPIKYKIDRVGLNIIAGPNGVGKTTITNALAYVGWGQLVKPKKSSIIPWPHVIDENYHGTRVLLKFSDGESKYQIIRCNEYKGKIFGKQGGNRLIVVKDNKLLEGPGLRNKADYQKWIIEKIGYSFELFKSAVLFTQELDSIMEEDGPARKKIFDEAFETTFINHARKNVEEDTGDKIRELNKVIQKSLVLMERKKGDRVSIKLAKERISQNEKLKQMRIEQIKEKLGGYNTQVMAMLGHTAREPEVQQDLRRWTKNHNGYGDVSKQEFNIMLLLNERRSKVEYTELRIKQLGALLLKPIKVCNACGNKIPKEKIIIQNRELKAEMKKCKVEVEILKDRIKTDEAVLKELEITLEKSKRAETKIRELNGELEGIERSKKEISRLLSLAKKEENNLLLVDIEFKDSDHGLKEKKAALRDTKVELKKLKVENKALTKEVNIGQWLMKDPLSNSGLKAFIFDSMLGTVNKYLSQYTTIIGFGMKVYIDMSSANKDIRILIQKGGDEVPFEDLSGGQKQLANIALTFSLGDTVQKIKPINAIFLDELFESLSVENVEKVGKIIEQKAKNRSIHLITHQRAFSPSNCNITTMALNNKKQTEIIC